MSQPAPSNQLTLFVEDSPVRTLALPESGRAWLESDLAYGLSFIAFCQSLNLLGLLSKTSPVYYPATAGEILPLSFVGWSNSGMASPGGYLTLGISEYPSAAVECSLSDILETDAPPRYFLSPRACQGILRRAERRGRPLPELLLRSLQVVAAQNEPGNQGDKTP